MMMNKTGIDFSKIKSCNQIWEDMPLKACGKVCSKCNQTMHDFRGLSEWDIALTHAKSETKVCGIYDKNRLEGTKNSFVGVKSKLLISGFIGFFTTNISAQTLDTMNYEKVAQVIQINAKDSLSSPIDKSPPESMTPSRLHMIRGTIVDVLGNPIFGAPVFIPGTEIGTITDLEGNFFIEYSAEKIRLDTCGLVCSYLGYARKEIDLSAYQNLDTIVLQESVVLIEDLTLISFGIRRLPWYRRWWLLIRNKF